MIILHFENKLKNITHISESTLKSCYKTALFNLSFSQIECPICHKKEWIFHGSYERNLIIQNRKYSFYITRVMCKHCAKTHAVIPDFLIPFMSRLAEEIIDAYSIEYVGHPHRPSLYSIFYTFFLLRSHMTSFLLRMIMVT